MGTISEGSRSPWGRVQYTSVVKRAIDGRTEGEPIIVHASTAGHGGWHVCRALNARIHPAWRRRGGWYEEDCEVAIVVVSFPELFDARMVADMNATARNYWPDHYTIATGRPVQVEESSVLRERRDSDLYADSWIATGAWGDWCDGATVNLGGEYVALGPVPKGHVGVVAVRGRDVDASRRYGFAGEERALLVTAEAYNDPAHRCALGQRVSPVAEHWPLAAERKVA